MKNLSSSTNLYSMISMILYIYYFYLPGSAITPTDAATLSPKDLLIANPGTSSSLSQTLEGPMN